MSDSKLFCAWIVPVLPLVDMFRTLCLKLCLLFFLLNHFWSRVVQYLLFCFLPLNPELWKLNFTVFFETLKSRCDFWVTVFEWFWRSRIWLYYWILALGANSFHVVEHLLTAELVCILENSVGTSGAVGIQISSRATMEAIFFFTKFSINLFRIKNLLPNFFFMSLHSIWEFLSLCHGHIDCLCSTNSIFNVV